MKKLYFLFCMIVAGSSLVHAQIQKVVADKIIAQVGDKIILRSDIMNALSDYRRQGQELPPNPECAFLQGQLIQKALVLQAEKDSLPITEDEIDAALDNRIRFFIGQYGGKEILEEIAGKNVYQIKEDLRQSLREQKLAEDMRRKVLENIKITPVEVNAYFAKIPKDSLAFYESEIEVSQIVIQPLANRDVDDYIIKQLYDYKKQVEVGVKKFEQLAKNFSEDPGTKDLGGQMNMNRNDKNWDPAFFSAAFKLKEGQISPVIKSKFGYHIIQMVSRSGDDAVVRHLLMIPPVTDEEVKIAVQKADSVRNLIVSRTMSFAEAVLKYTDDEQGKSNAGTIQGKNGETYITIDQLPDNFLVRSITDLKPGEYSKPQSYTDAQGRKMVRIVYLKTRTTPHRESLKDDYNKIAQRALDEKKQGVLEKWFKGHLPDYYITIDKEYNGCSSLADWWKYAAKN